MLELAELADELGVDARTLRRAAADGTIRCERVGARRQRVSEDERRYAAGHWSLLSALRRALRTEPNVRLAVVYGSFARGDDTPDSDLDLLVSLREDHADAAVKLAAQLDRLSAKLERLSAQRQALRKAMNQFGGNFNAKNWKEAFDSPEPDDINRVFMVTGGYLAL